MNFQRQKQLILKFHFFCTGARDYPRLSIPALQRCRKLNRPINYCFLSLPAVRRTVFAHLFILSDVALSEAIGYRPFSSNWVSSPQHRNRIERRTKPVRIRINTIVQYYSWPEVIFQKYRNSTHTIRKKTLKLKLNFTALKRYKQLYRDFAKWF